MNKTLFATDLDNTIIFSYKHKIDTDLCIEHLDGKELSFVAEGMPSLLRAIREKMLFVPVTTRSIEQYRRIEWPESCRPFYAVTTNGAILLEDGQVNTSWYSKSKELVVPWQKELVRMQKIISEIPELSRVRLVDDMYLFAPCDNKEEATKGATLLYGKTELDVETSGRKVYFFPPSINKGEAINRLKEKFSPHNIICAGDSVIDIPMLNLSNIAIAPTNDFLKGNSISRKYSDFAGTRFPDYVLECMSNEI